MAGPRTVPGMSRIARLPEPPYYAVIAPATLGPDIAGYPKAATAALEIASALPGFHGIETCIEPGFAVAVSYWQSLEAIEAWRQHERHQRVKELGRSRWFTGYATRIARVIDAY
jgi:heme-degrading monooxygenase HmoA